MQLIVFFSNILTIINTVLVPLIFTLAFLVFVWGIYQYFIAGGADEDARKKGRMFAIYGFLGFFIMFSIWGIINILLNTAALDTTRPAVPSFGGSCVVQVLGICL